MKNKAHLILFSLLVVCSLSSYTYLHWISTHAAADGAVVESEETLREQNEVLLPDIRLVKKAVELGRKVVDITQ